MGVAITVSQAAEIMGVSSRSAKRSLRNANVKMEMSGNVHVVNADDLRAFLTERAGYNGRGRPKGTMNGPIATEGKPYYDVIIDNTGVAEANRLSEYFRTVKMINELYDKGIAITVADIHELAHKKYSLDRDHDNRIRILNFNDLINSDSKSDTIKGGYTIMPDTRKQYSAAFKARVVLEALKETKES